MSVEKDVKEILAMILCVDESNIIPGAEIINDLGADSLDKVELIMAFEDEFSIEIPEEDAEKFKYVRDIINYIDSRV